MPSLNHISLTTGDAWPVPRAQFNASEIEQVGRAIRENGGAVPGSGWSIKVSPIVMAGADIYEVHHGPDIVARCWLCSDPAAQEWLWTAATSINAAQGVALTMPTAGPWLATAQLPDGARLMQDWPDVRPQARRLLRQAAWALIRDYQEWAPR
jgi:hypothetical protein